MGLLAREAGKTYANAIAEVREAVDFLRYYAVQARNDFSNDAHRPLGPVVCISPWNFPLAIFSGQVAAALAAGNPNAMIVDSSALTEQVVIDVVSSAFDSAGQRCSALRVLCLQEDSADRVIEMLKGAMAESRLGNPERLSVDIGPVIDAEAKAGIEKHIQGMRDKGRNVYQVAIADGEEIKRGTFVMPTLIELESFDELQREIFGPVLHVVRYNRKHLDQLIEQINASGYGLTLGVHTRIDETIAKRSDAGTAPDVRLREQLLKPLQSLKAWAGSNQQAELAQLCEQFAQQSQSGVTRLLNGPTGERNSYTILPREHVLCLAESEADLLTQLAAVLAVGSSAVFVDGEPGKALRGRLPKDVQARIKLVSDWAKDEVVFDAVLHHGHSDQLRAVCEQVAKRAGAIVGVQGLSSGETAIALERLPDDHRLTTEALPIAGQARPHRIDGGPCGSGLDPRCAARAALDLECAGEFKAYIAGP
uniref:L-glutamate gamma-semialdehyde dehydrogenase n=1 Tax=Steinernema glaseri TaxID=37863 RepID=A0A1I7XWP6_9BILA